MIRLHFYLVKNYAIPNIKVHYDIIFSLEHTQSYSDGYLFFPDHSDSFKKEQILDFSIYVS